MAVSVGILGVLNYMLIPGLTAIAGKFELNYGVPFDLEELADSSNIDIDEITHIRVIDVVGSINTEYASYDALGNIINDPWPTNFPSSGFDLDAVAVIHYKDDSNGY